MALLAATAYALWASPFVRATGPFANFEKGRAIPAGLIGICGTVIIILWGWLLMRIKGGNNQGAGKDG